MIYELIMNEKESAIQTEAPSRVSFATTANAWLIYDAYAKDQQQKEAAAAAAAAVAAAAAAATTASSASSDPASMLQSQQPGAGNAGSLSGNAAVRFEETVRVIERMINQNIYDEIAQG